MRAERTWMSLTLTSGVSVPRLTWCCCVQVFCISFHKTQKWSFEQCQHHGLALPHRALRLECHVYSFPHIHRNMSFLHIMAELLLDKRMLLPIQVSLNLAVRALFRGGRNLRESLWGKDKNRTLVSRLWVSSHHSSVGRVSWVWSGILWLHILSCLGQRHN